MTVRVSTLKNREVRLRVMTIRPNTLVVSWYEGVYHKVSVEANWVSRPCQVYIKDSVVVGKKMTTVRKNDNYSAIAHPAWMINTLFDIDCLAQYEPSIYVR